MVSPGSTVDGPHVPDLDPVRLIVAAHELGHAVVWSVTGMRVESIEVTGRGLGTNGCVVLANRAHLSSAADCRSYLLGMLAGSEAENRWCGTTGTRPTVDGCAHDRREFGYMYRRRRPWGVTESRAALRTQARQLVRAHWPAIARLAPRLALRGSLPTDALPTPART